jgi:hypothetical protein
MSTYADSTCPECGADVTVEYWETYQGVRPHGGYVTRSEISDKSCDCEWTDDDLEAIRESETVRTKADRNFSPEELYGY